MGCEGCYQSLKEQNQQFVSVQAEAKELAVKNACNVFIYKDENGWTYMAEEAARALGITPTGGIVSRFVSST